MADIPAHIIGSNSRGSAKSIEPVTYRLFHYEATVFFLCNDSKNKYADVLSFFQLSSWSGTNFAHLHLHAVVECTRWRMKTFIPPQFWCRAFIATSHDLQCYDVSIYPLFIQNVARLDFFFCLQMICWTNWF